MMTESGKFWVYILRCCDGTLYTGMAADVKQRETVHNSGRGAKYTRSRLPVKLVYAEFCGSRSDALKREATVKKLTREQKLKLIAQNSDNVL